MVAISEEFYWIAAFAVVAALVNGTGIIAILQRRGWAERSLPYLIMFARAM